MEYFMKDNQLTEIIKYWNEMSFAKKASALQKFENYNSQFLNRSEREVILTSELIDLYDQRISYFDTNNPDYIFVNNKKDITPILFASAVYQSGLLASIDDFYKNKADIIAFEPINKDKFLKHHLVELAMKNSSFEFDHGIKTIGQEQRFVQRESALYLIYTLLTNCQTSQDCLDLYQEYSDIFEKYYLYLDLFNQKMFEQSYYQQRLSSFNSKTQPDNLPQYLSHFKKQIIVPTQISSSQIEFLINHFDKNLKLFTAFKELETIENKKENYHLFINNFISDSQELGV